MNYLKLFNEGVSDLTYLEILDFCEENLAYLMDDGFTISLQSDRFNNEIDWEVRLRNSENLKWDYIENHLVPFFVHLDKEFELCNISSTHSELELFVREYGINHGYKWLSIKDLLNREGDYDKLVGNVVESITFYIKSRK
jgi:hypothetical protein